MKYKYCLFQHNQICRYADNYCYIASNEEIKLYKQLDILEILDFNKLEAPSSDGIADTPAEE